FMIKEIFLAIPSAPTKAKRRIMHICKNAKVKFKTLPDMGELLTGRVRVSDLREFQIDDVLGRDQVRLDTLAIKEYIRGKTILITGAGGSIGSELCRQVSQFSPAKMVLLDQSEYNLYQIEMNMKEHSPGIALHPLIGDILNQNKIERILKQYRPEVVFHAAAYKHVPLMETNPEEALRTNTFGTWTIARLSHLHGVQKFVMISTDKAVRPTNVMGASKRIAEMICQEFGRTSNTKFVTVRFGNVLNSVGSVIPLFKRQIAAGGPITVTHPDIYRYFMTIPEAVQLIMQAGSMGQGGEIFILDMGEPVRIVDLARDMITLSGLEPERDIKIVFTGLRPGEKMYEELLTESEEVTSTLHEKIKVVKTNPIDWPPLLAKIEKLLDSLRGGHGSEIMENIKTIVPDYQPEQGGPDSQEQGPVPVPLFDISGKPLGRGNDALLHE
ncbi:MAG TPA: nucleoside-diphosphate sugar epimerase/dehydratase, partial [Nitrospirota bacterium]|nr:nucleoside-diphosphate sugar epimerase/dehydratase [Nitrospirota bacterium]